MPPTARLTSDPTSSTPSSPPLRCTPPRRWTGTGPSGTTPSATIAGRSSIRYWLDHAFADKGHSITHVAKLPPPRFELDVAPEPKSSARCCSGPGPKHKFGVGEPRLALSLWEPLSLDSHTVARAKTVTCCLSDGCVADFERKHGVSIADAVPAAHLCVDALVAVEARQDELVAAKAEGAPPAPAKSDTCFPHDRKREPTHYDCGVNPWGKLAIDDERFNAEATRCAEALERLQGPAGARARRGRGQASA